MSKKSLEGNFQIQISRTPQKKFTLYLILLGLEILGKIFTSKLLAS